eukprot:TRINITY_DN5409_c0_g1_i2.p1 TRINITY_DN5409_c0_g1~~TRINITY_DN5409_c0_g1_i2.p1  ORF type:complete len:392 (+),score=32.63 TRINITY_DN5409_c0_g1_i2:159-1334(+)
MLPSLPQKKIVINGFTPSVFTPDTSSPTGSDYFNERVIYCQSNKSSNYKHGKGFKKIGYGIVGALWAAFYQNADVVLTPDDVWLAICQAFSNHVNHNAEKLRHHFVDHDGKKELVIFLPEHPKIKNTWEKLIEKFQATLKVCVKGSAAKSLECDFTTTKEIEKAVSGIITMCTFKKYYKYKVLLAKAAKREKDKRKYGIRNVIFQGTLGDWNRINDKLEALKKFEAGSWILPLQNIIDKFIETFNGTVDKRFWNNVVGTEGEGPNKELTGWAVAFFPYKTSGSRTEKKIVIKEIPEQVIDVPFTLETSGKNERYKCRAGFTGLLYENEGFRPQLTYAITQARGKSGKSTLTHSQKSLQDQCLQKCLSYFSCNDEQLNSSLSHGNINQSPTY